MAALVASISRLLSEATAKQSVPPLREAFTLLQQVCETSAVVGRGRDVDAPPDLYLFCCEAALRLQEWEIAEHCEARLLETRATTTTTAAAIRVLYCRATLDSYRARGLRCAALVDAALLAVAKVLKGMRLAGQDVAQHGHLVVAGTMHLWNAARVLYKRGTFDALTAPIGAAVAALERVNHHDWLLRATWMLRHAAALSGAGRHQDAATVVTRAGEVVARSVPQLRFPFFRMQVALTKHVANPKVRQDAAKGLLRALFASQAVLCGAIDGPAAESEALGALQELMAEFATSSPANPAAAASGAPTQPPKASGAGGTKGEGGKKGAPGAGGEQSTTSAAEDAAAREEVLAELGLALALLGLTTQAAEVGDRCAHAKPLRARVFGEFTQALVKAASCGGLAVQRERHSNFCDAEMVQGLVSATRKIDRALESAARITNDSDRSHVVQIGCVLLWNTALPLLQPATRGHVTRSLQAAAKLLDDLGSNMNVLRTMLHHEVALCDMDAELVGKAAARVDKALGIDYEPPAEEAQLYALERPLDRFLVWMRRRLSVKANLYLRPDNPEDEALLILEQARDAPLLARLSMLTRAAAILSATEPAESYALGKAPPLSSMPAAAGDGKHGAKGTQSTTTAASNAGKKQGKGSGGAAAAAAAATESQESAALAAQLDPQVEQQRRHLRDRGHLWHIMLQLAWKDRAPSLVEVTRTAAEHLLRRSWPRAGDRDMRLLQADAALKAADTFVVVLETRGLHVAQRTFDNEGAHDDSSDDDNIEGNGAEGVGGAADGAAAASHELDTAEARDLAEKASAVAHAQERIHHFLTEAAQIGSDLVARGWPDHWVVMNAATALWNYHTEAFAANDFLAPAATLQVLLPALLSLDLDPKKETTLLSNIGSAFVQSLLQQFIAEKLGLDDSVEAALQVMSLDYHTFTVVADAAHPKLQQAAEVCETLIERLPTPMDARPFCALSATIRRFQGKPAEVRGHPQMRIATILEQLTFPGASSADKGAMLSQALSFLQQDPNIELCARLAEQSLRLPGSERITVRIATVGQRLYDEGRLGWRQNEVPAGSAATTVGKGAAKGGAAGKGGGAAAAAAAAVAAAEAAAVAAAAAAATAAELPKPTQEDWMWYSLLLELRGLGVIQLLDPAVQDKEAQHEVRRQALVAFTNSALAALQGPAQFRTPATMKALRHFHQHCAAFAADATVRRLAFDSLRQLLAPRVVAHVVVRPPSRDPRGGGAGAGQQPMSSSAAAATRADDGQVVAHLFLLLLRCMRDRGLTDEGLAAMRTAIKLLPPLYHRPFWDLDVQLRCEAGMPTNQTLLRVKEYSPETQAQVWVALARNARSPQDQHFGYLNAVQVLQGQPTEQAEYMLALAQWMLTANINTTLASIRTVALAAVDTIGDSLSGGEPEDDGAFTDIGSAAGRSVANSGAPATQFQRQGSSTSMASIELRRSFSERGTATVRTASSQRPRRDRPARATAKQLQIAIQAFYLLAKIGAPGESCDGVPVDPRSCLEMAVHYVMRMWVSTVAAVNAHHAKLRARRKRADGRSKLLREVGAPGAAPSGANTDASAPGPELGKRGGGKKGQPGGQADSAATGAVPVAADSSGVGGCDIPGPIDIPSTAIGWAMEVVPPALAEALRSMRSLYAITAASVESPETLLAVLGDLAALLRRWGLAELAPAVLSLMRLVVDVFLNGMEAVADAARKATLLQQWHIAEQVGLGALSSLCRVGHPQTSTHNRAALLEDARMAAETPHSTLNERGGGSNEAGTSARQQQQQQQQQQRSLPPPPRITLVDGEAQWRVHGHWLALCDLLLLEGRHATARAMLHDACVHARAYRDTDAVTRCALLRARLLCGEGRLEDALEAVLSAIPGGKAQHHASMCAELWAALKEVEVRVLLQLHRFQDAVAAADAAHQQLSSQAAGASNVHLQLHEAIAPVLGATLALGCAGAFVDAVRATMRLGPSAVPDVGLQQITADAVRRARETGDPLLQAAALLTQLEGRALQQHLDAANDAQVQLLHEAGEIHGVLRELIRGHTTTYAGASMSRHAALLSAPRPMIARLHAAAAANLLRRVLVSARQLEGFRHSKRTLMAYPINEAAPAELEAGVVSFMRNTRKQREAAARIKRRHAARVVVEQRRAVAREEKQAELEQRREQRRAEEAVAPAKKEAKGVRKPGAAAAAAAAAAEAAAADLAEVDPSDKCGIESPPVSDDDGAGEDSNSEEELEWAAAAQAPAGIADGVSLAQAIVLYTAAAEAAVPLTRQRHEAVLGLAEAHLLKFERALIGLEHRQAVLRGQPYPSVLRSSAIGAKWCVVPAGAAALEEERRTAAPIKEDARKRAAGREGAARGAATGAAAPAAPTPPVPETQVKGPVVPGIVPDAVRQMQHALEEVIAQAHGQVEDFAVQAGLLLRYAHCCVVRDQPQLAARALEAAQAMRTAAHVVAVWETAAFADAQEMVLWAAVRRMRREAPALVGAPQYHAAVRALLSGSRMFAHLRLPDAAAIFTASRSSTDDEPASPSLASDYCCLTLLGEDPESRRCADPESVTLFAVLRRPTGPALLHRCRCDAAVLRRAEQAMRAHEGARGAQLAGVESAAATAQKELDEELENVVALTDALLAPLLAPFQPIIDTIAQHSHLILCIDASLSLASLPVELAEPVRPFRSVARELSLFTASMKLARRGAPDAKLAGAAVTLVVDAHREHPELHAALFDDKGARPSNWTVATAAPDEHGFLRPLATSQLQRLLTTTTTTTTTAVAAAPAVVVVATCGRFTNTLPLPAIATLPLSHIRVWCMLDRGTNNEALRRESQATMAKDAGMQLCETPWNIGYLLLARGVECLVAHTAPVSTRFLNHLGRLVVANLERGQPRHFGELVRQVVVGDAFARGRSAARGNRPSQAGQPPQKGASAAASPDVAEQQKMAAHRLCERGGVVVFGVSPEDMATPASKAAGKQ